MLENYSYDLEKKCFVLIKSTSTMSLHTSKMVISEDKWNNIQNSELKYKICSKNQSISTKSSRFSIKKCPNPKPKSKHYYHTKCLLEQFPKAKYKCPVCNFDLFYDELLFLQQLCRAMANEKDTIAQNFDIFSLPYSSNDKGSLKYFSEFAKVSISYEELWCIINNMELYLKTNTHDEMAVFVNLLKKCGSEKHFFEISKEELYNEIISQNFNFSPDAEYSVVINSNHDFLVRLSDDQLTELLSIIACKKISSDLMIAYFKLIFTHMFFISRQLPDHLLARIVINLLDHSNHPLLVILHDLELNFFEREGSIAILRTALKNNDSINHCITLLDLNIDQDASLEVLMALGTIEDEKIKLGIVTKFLQYRGFSPSYLSLKQIQEVLDHTYQIVSICQSSHLEVYLMQFVEFFIHRSYKQLTDTQKDELYICYTLIVQNETADFNTSKKLLELLPIYSNSLSLMTLFRNKIINPHNIENFLDSIYQMESLVLYNFFKCESFCVIFNQISPDEFAKILKRIQILGLMKYCPTLLRYFSPEQTEILTPSQYEEIKQAAFCPLSKFPDSFIYTVENFKESGFKLPISSAIFENSHIELYEDRIFKAIPKVVAFIAHLPKNIRYEWIESILCTAPQSYVDLFHFLMVASLIHLSEKPKKSFSLPCCTSSTQKTPLERFVDKYAANQDLFDQEFGRDLDKALSSITKFPFDEVLEKFLDF